ncbi:hypothetical protein [Secundilactobacillus folii]|uniref:Mga helix-turn-helix domain-containing protein n=1 Tax=Secundilactobacillus folii TaxID=2678357 RepID=A0A7X2XVV7_9LACO|nr:hypothetical protein [Secundilactobacillus folii]MTV82563.1 hypothetical protein [Secundilactobacillus folii]
MDYSYLFTKNDAINYHILTAFNHRDDHVISKRQIAKTNHFTNYQLHKHYELINADLLQVSGQHKSKIVETEELTWHAQNLNDYVLQKVALLYLHRAPLYTGFKFHFFYDNQFTKRQYIDANYMSTSVFYRTLDQLDGALTQNHFLPVNMKPNEAEFITRLRLFQFYNAMYSTGEQPFNELTDQVNSIIDAVQSHVKNGLRPTEITKLATFTRIWLLRMNNGNALPAGLITAVTDSPNRQRLLAQLKPILPDKKEFSDTEFNYFYLFLVSQGFCGQAEMVKTANNFPTIGKLSDQFIRHLKVNEDQQFTVDMTQLKPRLQAIHLRLVTFFIEWPTFSDSRKTKFLAELYPIFNRTVTQMIADLQKNGVIELNELTKTNLYFSYMFALIDSVSQAFNEKPIHICVDFSQGALYTDYVIDSLKTFNSTQLTVDNRLTSQTDIYVSDLYTRQIKLPQVIWANPPTATDWAKIADLILKIRQRRHRCNKN